MIAHRAAIVVVRGHSALSAETRPLSSLAFAIKPMTQSRHLRDFLNVSKADTYSASTVTVERLATGPDDRRIHTESNMRRFASVPAHRLRWLAIRTKKCPSHPLPVGKAGFVGDHVHRMPPLLYHHSRCLDAHVLDRLRR